jgi:hypothetical protein
MVKEAPEASGASFETPLSRLLRMRATPQVKLILPIS